MPSKYQRKARTREPNKTIIIATEGNRTEILYFEEVRRQFRISALKILRRNDEDTRSAPQHVIEQLHQYCKDHRVKEVDEFWLVIDKDHWTEEQLSLVASTCISKGYYLALSNPCFELWLLLHFLDISQQIIDNIHLGNTVKEKLEEYRIAQQIGSYSQIVTRINIAIENAKKLDVDTTTRWINTVGTRVYQLAISLFVNQ